jgi:hypothetical protein
MGDGASGTRPGGLTALAIINFIFGSFGLIGAMLNLAQSGDPENPAVVALGGRDALLIHAVVGGLVSILLIVIGIGFIGQKRVMGRVLGNVYGILALVSSAVTVASMGFNFIILIGLVYPLLMLLLINGTFKDDLVN